MNIIHFGGSGWLGQYTLKALKEHRLWVSSRNPKSIHEFKFDLNELKIPQGDIYLYTIPPSKIKLEDLKLLLDKLDITKKFILTSSSSAYSNAFKNCTEELELIQDASTNETVLQTEILIKEKFQNHLILRLAGLAGENRNPANFLTGKKNIANGKGPVNLVHGEDVANIIKFSIEQNLQGVYNICCNEHPGRQDFYTEACKKAGLPLPQFIDNLESEKIIDNSKIKKVLNYQFKYPSPYNMI
jgi:nucleoside-diphosphate-sugar epimerase